MGTENNISVLAQAGRSEYTKEHDGILREMELSYILIMVMVT